jgi:hypothetical protein
LFCIFQTFFQYSRLFLYVYISCNICFRNSFSSFISYARSIPLTRLLPFVLSYFPATKTSRYLNNVSGISQRTAEAEA